MKKSHILAVLALAMALGLAAPALLSSDSKASAEEGAPEGATSAIERNVPDGMVAPVELDEANAETQTGDETISAEAAGNLDELKAALASDAETIIIENTITLTEDLDLQGKTETRRRPEPYVCHRAGKYYYQKRHSLKQRRRQPDRRRYSLGHRFRR